jgi:hypothetical protein
MFESMTDRIAGTVLMGLDVAVEFATLGEYRLVEADLAPASAEFQAAPLVRRPTRLAEVAPDNRLLPPASTAIARAAAESAARAAARRGQRAAGRDSGVRRPTPNPFALPGGRGAATVIPNAPRRRAVVPPPARVKTAPRTRGGAVEAGAQLCLFGR